MAKKEENKKKKWKINEEIYENIIKNVYLPQLILLIIENCWVLWKFSFKGSEN